MAQRQDLFELAEEVLEETVGKRTVKLVEIDGRYELWGDSYLMQAVGTCLGTAFMFHAKHGHWEFETETEVGHPFPVDDPRHFHRSGEFDETRPHTMTMEWATRIVRRCLAEMWAPSS
jgi:hypothetical protein